MKYVLTLSCPDRRGIVHAVASYLVGLEANITESQQFGDPETGRFFMRIEVEADTTLEELRGGFAETAERFAMDVEVRPADAPLRTLVMVSQHLHVLNDLLFRAGDTINAVVPVVVSNHRDAEPLVRNHGIAFEHVPVTRETKPAAEARLLELVAEHDVELVVLARYMQILSDDLCRALTGRAINIHHSFLPSFKGAKPYHAAYDRGVKLVGATAHYVTADLDEGPIIEQDVTRVDHTNRPADLVAAGRDVEAQVLSRAVRWHAESRVLLNGHRTVVFR
jgi:formyltetrahydrofolate deformylase